MLDLNFTSTSKDTVIITGQTPGNFFPPAHKINIESMPIDRVFVLWDLLIPPWGPHLKISRSWELLMVWPGFRLGLKLNVSTP